MERRLGRGLGSLLGGLGEEEGVVEIPRPTPEAAGPASREGGLAPARLPIQAVRPNPNQPRKVFDSALLEELRDSIRAHGVLQPICVRTTPREPGEVPAYEIVAGERRWRAARLAGLREIPAVVLEGLDDEKVLELALVENVQRADLDPIEKAQAFQTLVQGLGLTQEQVAERVGLKRSSVTNHLRLLELPEEAQDALRSGLISMGHAKVLMGQGPKTIRTFLGRIVREDLSVRALEVLLKGDLSKATAGTPHREAVPAEKPERKEPWANQLESRLRERLGARAEVQNGTDYQGKIVLHYHDRAELERLIEALAPDEPLV